MRSARCGFEAGKPGAERGCHSPLRYWTPVGHRLLRVRAIGPTGLRGPITSVGFQVMRPRHRGRASG